MLLCPLLTCSGQRLVLLLCHIVICEKVFCLLRSLSMQCHQHNLLSYHILSCPVLSASTLCTVRTVRDSLLPSAQIFCSESTSMLLFIPWVVYRVISIIIIPYNNISIVLLVTVPKMRSCSWLTHCKRRCLEILMQFHCLLLT